MDNAEAYIRYSDVFTVVSATGQHQPQGDKIVLPPSALQAILDATAKAQQRAQREEQRHNQYTSPFGLYDAAPASTGTAEASIRNGELPQPLTFQLTNPANQRAVYAGIREFSADEGHVVLSRYLRTALGIGSADGTDDPKDTAAPTIMVAFHMLPKGTFVHLRPLEAGYNPVDWRALLERHLREGFTTLTKDSVLTVRGSGAGETFCFRIDGFKPEGAAICVVDTDLEVDIEALDEEQALETARQIQAKGEGSTDGRGSSGSSVGGKMDIFKPIKGQVLPGDYVDYELSSWDRSRPLEISIVSLRGGNESGDADDDDNDRDPGYAVDLLASPRAPRQRAFPRQTEHVWSNFSVVDGSDAKKIITIAPLCVELEDADALLIAVHGWKPPATEVTASQPPRPHLFEVRARVVLEEEVTEQEEKTQHGSDEEECGNCLQWVPKRTMVLHEGFCRRNNVACPQCRHVFQKTSAAWQSHWHCNTDPMDGGHGNTTASRAKHNELFHTFHTCPAETCAPADGGTPSSFATFASVSELAHHRTTTCPAKRILCQFCHLEVPQEGDPTDPSTEAATMLLTGMTTHERVDGARTTDCYLCDAIVRMRDMRAHMQHHDLDRQRRISPAICSNTLCGKTRYGVGSRGQVHAAPGQSADGMSSANSGNPLGLCSSCFVPLYVSTHDPDGRVLRRRVERRYLSQLLTGCGNAWCGNEWCKTGRLNRKMEPLAGQSAGGTAALLPLVKPLVADAMESFGSVRAAATHFCVDEANQKRRAVADMLAGQGRYGLPWCVAACEAEGPNATRAWDWLSSWAAEG